ncbi:MAG: PEP-CTERM sorting domain-containing protein [Phycisphaeraceae bacterium]|nr:PEP-CTERM sorting domain-containing protein [Phycisphaerales bacterium]MCB9861482.1 PEP-CTERM sorting domain-containing protein [Phycisphaeraceae bacterium]
MKKAMAVVAIAGLATVASADEVFNIGSISLVGPLASQTFNFTSTSAGLTGFAFQGDFLDPTNGAAYASDLRMLLTAPSGEIYDIGGFSNVTNDWDFQGSGSNPPGFYSHAAQDFAVLTGPGAPANTVGTWTIELIQDWNSTSVNARQDWDNMVVTLVPAPGSLALLGMGGLVAARRRRG